MSDVWINIILGVCVFSFLFICYLVLNMSRQTMRDSRISNCKECGGSGILPCNNTECGCDGYPCVCVKPSKKKHIYQK